MSENKITFPAKLASNNPQSFGIADATDISGHKSVDTLSGLYAISDPVLSTLKNGSDAIGQEWFVVSEDCKYRLDNWANRKSVAGWTKLPKQELINTKQSVSEKNQPSGYAGLDSNGKIPIEKTYGTTATVVNVNTYESLPVTGLSGVIYYVSNTSAQYKWSGSSYVDITDGADKAKKNETSIFDCSNGTSTKYYSSLSEAINVVPPVYRTSNRIISYLSTENSTTSAVNYQYHGIDSTTWTNLTKWEHIPNQADLAEIRSELGQYFDSEEYIQAYTDNAGNFLFGIKSDGSINWSKGIPFPIQKKIIELNQQILDNKISIEQANIILDYFSTEVATDFIYVIKDNEDKVIFGIKSDGSIFKKNVKNEISNQFIKEYLSKIDILKTYLFEHMMVSGTHISPVENMTTIPCGFDVDKDGNVYLAIEAANNSTGEMSAAKFITELITFNLADPEKTKQSYVIYPNNEGYFTHSGQQYYNVTPHEGIVKLFGNSARVLATIWEDYTKGMWIMWRDFDITTKDVGAYQPCTVDINGVVYEMIKPNAQSIVNAMGNEIFPWTQGGTDYREPDIYLFTDAVLINGWYYCAINIGSGGHVLLKSQDLKAWFFVSDIPIGYYSEEVVLITDKTNRYIYAISRGRNNYYPSTSGDAKVLKYDITNKSWSTKKATLSGSRGDRPTMAYKDGYIYAFVGIPALQKRVDGYTISRNGKRMYVLDTNLNVLKYYDFTCQFGCESPMLANIHGNLFMFMCCDPRGYFATEYGSEGRSGIIFSYIDNRMFNL